MDGLGENIISLIPQKAPFVMIDKLVHSDEKTTRTILAIRADNILLEDGFFSAAGLVENIAQTAAARVGFIARELNEEPPVGYIGAIKNLEIFALPETGDVIETEITISNHIFDVTIITGKVTNHQKVIAQCEMKIFINQQKPVQ
jgi:predicted hotdog family 3-hydroxylacyl-ACP dehydratase